MLASVEVLDTCNLWLGWQPGPDLPAPRYAIDAAGVSTRNGQIFVVGGKGGEGARTGTQRRARRLKDVLVLDMRRPVDGGGNKQLTPHHGQWVTCAELAAPLSGHAAAVVG